jgi:hypothetical protein
VAPLVKEKSTAKGGIAIVEGGERKIKIGGGGKLFGNGGVKKRTPERFLLAI